MFSVSWSKYQAVTFKKFKKYKEAALKTTNGQLPVAIFYFCFYVHFIKFVSKLTCLFTPQDKGIAERLVQCVLCAAYRRWEAFLFG